MTLEGEGVSRTDLPLSKHHDNQIRAVSPCRDLRSPEDRDDDAATAVTYAAQAPTVTYAAPRSAMLRRELQNVMQWHAPVYRHGKDLHEGKTVLQDILTMYNEVNCVDKKLGVEHRSHRDGRAREPDRPDCTVPAQWRGAPRIPRNSRSRISRSVTRCSG